MTTPPAPQHLYYHHYHHHYHYHYHGQRAKGEAKKKKKPRQHKSNPSKAKRIKARRGEARQGKTTHTEHPPCTHNNTPQQHAEAPRAGRQEGSQACTSQELVQAASQSSQSQSRLNLGPLFSPSSAMPYWAAGPLHVVWMASG